MLTLGVDQSARNSGVCILDDTGKPTFLQRITPPKELCDTERLQFIRNSLQEIITTHPGIVKAAMEGYSYSSINQKFTLGEIGGVVKLVLADYAIPLLIVAPK
jgi:Holliday junction resolvasome RuvABC endonuclease subunit